MFLDTNHSRIGGSDGSLETAWLVAVPVVVWLAARLHDAEKPPFADEHTWGQGRTRGRLVWLITFFVWALTALVLGLHYWI